MNEQIALGGVSQPPTEVLWETWKWFITTTTIWPLISTQFEMHILKQITIAIINMVFYTDSLTIPTTFTYHYENNNCPRLHYLTT